MQIEFGFNIQAAVHFHDLIIYVFHNLLLNIDRQLYEGGAKIVEYVNLWSNCLELRNVDTKLYTGARTCICKL